MPSREQLLAADEAEGNRFMVAQLNEPQALGYILSSDNLADLFTKSLPMATFRKLVHSIRLRRLNDLN